MSYPALAFAAVCRLIRTRGLGRALPAIVLVLAVPGCATPTPTFPPDYRERIAVSLLREFDRAGRGPAEISLPTGAQRSRGDGWLPSNLTYVRYPVRENWGLFRDSSAIVHRCIEIGRNLFDRSNYVASRPSSQISESHYCRSEIVYEPFTELNALLERVRACRARGEPRCEIAGPGNPLPGPTSR